MSEKQRDNYFILLDLDPNRSYSDAEITKAIKLKGAQWTQEQTIPAKKQISSRNIKQIPRIQKVMLDPQQRKIEAKEALNLNADNLQAEQAKLEAQLQLMQVDGSISENVIAGLAKEFALFDVAKIKSVARRLSLAVEAGGGSTATTDFKLPDMLSRGDMDRIQRNLDALDKGYTTLYEFLGLTRTTSRQDLVEAASTKNKEALRNAVKDDKNTAKATLAGEASAIFSNPNRHAQYNNSLDNRKWNDLEDKFKKMARLNGNQLSAAHYDNLVKQAKSEGLDVNEADARLRHWSKDNRVAIEVTSNLQKIDRLPQCIYCHTIDETGTSVACRNCGKRLRIQCPSCGTDNPIEDKSCSKCGFPTGNHVNATINLERAQIAIRQHDYEDALNQLRFVQTLWLPVYNGTPLQDDLNRQVRDALTYAKEQYEQNSTIAQQIVEAAQHNAYYTARQLFMQLPDSGYNDTLRKIQADTDDAIRRVENQLSQLKRSTLDISEREMIQHVSNILAICSDCEPARQILQDFPPSPPTQVRTTSSGEIVRVVWQASPSPNVRYTIVRKVGSRPVSLNDGDIVAHDLATTSWDDTTVPIGIPLFYGVYADRWDVMSLQAGVSNPVMRIKEVNSPSAIGSDNTVTITWETPQNAIGVAVQRLGNVPVRLQVVGETAQDTNLQNGVSYQYQIVAIYRDETGELVRSQGIEVSAIPDTPPEPIVDLRIEEQEQNELLLTWSSPNRGKAYILISDRNLGFDIGDRYTVEELSGLGRIQQGVGNTLQVTRQSMTLQIFTPLVVLNNMAIIGKSRRYVGIAEVEALSVQVNQHDLAVSWRWPSDCDRVRVSYSLQNYPDHPDASHAVSKEITRADFDMMGGRVSIQKSTDADYFVLVQTMLVRNRETLYSAGRRKAIRLASRIEIYYEVVPGRLFSKPYLKLQFKGQGIVPRLVIVSARKYLPETIADGVFVDTIEGLVVSDGFEKKFQLEKPTQSQTVYKVFLEDESAYDTNGGNITIYTPSRKKLTLG